MTTKRGSDEAFVQEMAAEPDAPLPPVDWTRLSRILDELDRAMPAQRDLLFAQAMRAAGDNEAAKSLVDRKKRTLGIDGAA